MKPQKAKEEYILLRAEGKSYDAIAQELHISKSTCSAWEKELEQAIADRKAEQLEQLYESYYMKKEARIKRLGGTLANIEDALAAADLTQMQPKELLEYKLKYTAALKEEYTGIAPALPTDITPAALLAALQDLLNRVRAGEVTTEQANRESSIISNALRAYEQTELKTKLEALEAALGK